MNETSPLARKASWRGGARYLAFALASLATLLALAYACENWRGRRAWQAHRRAWEAKGEKFDLAETMPAAMPDEKNLAMAPLLRPLLDCTAGPEGVVWHDTNGLARVRGIMAGLPSGHGTNARLELASLEKETFADLAAWGEFYRDNTNYPAAPPGASPAETVVAALNKFEPEFRELREAAAARPGSRFPVQYSQEPPWGIMLPHLAAVKTITMALQARATAELELGRVAEAFEDFKSGLRLSESIREEPIVISHLVRMVTLGMAVQTIREGLMRHAWTGGQLAEFQAALGAVNLPAEYKMMLRGERAGGVAELDYLRRHGGWGVEVEQFFGKDVTTCERLLRWAPSGWVYQNMLVASIICQDFSLPAVDERARRVFPDISQSGSRALETRRGPFVLFARLFHPSLDRTLQRMGRMQTFVDAARVACALERYRRANGAFPETLAALVPRFCDTLPTDLIDGKPLRWRLRADGGYRLYSVGWNQTDEGGELGWSQSDDSGVMSLMKEKNGAWVDPAKGDWVWQMPGR